MDPEVGGSSPPNCTNPHFIRGDVLDQAIQLHQSGRLSEAEALYRRVLAAQPRNIDALHMLAILCAQTGRPAQGLDWIGRALALNPSFPEAWCNRGNMLLELARWDEALAAYDRTIALGLANASVHANRGKALGGLQRSTAALESFDAALALEPDNVAALSDRGVVLMQLGRHQDALDSYHRALSQLPIATIFANRANALQEMLRPDEALASFDLALALEPAHGETLWNKSLCLLRAGRLAEGLALYESRRKRAIWNDVRDYGCPEWTGAELLQGKILLIHAEQGLGDTIQFCRYAALAKARGASVILSVQSDAMVRLFQALPVPVQGPGVLPKADFHIPLLSLPLAFGTTLATIPADIPYLAAEPERVAHWGARIGAQGFRIGVCWQGQAQVETARHFAPELLALLAALPGVRLISLQKGGTAPVDRIESPGADFDTGPDAFLDSAALMQSLDLVITVDTAIAHLAGALGRPTWVALRHLPDWRWFMERDDNPWYPGMRLFRQRKAGDWESVLSQMQAALTARR